MKTADIKLINKLGLHIRASNVLVNTAQRFHANITLIYNNKRADAKSIMSLMLLGAACGAVLTLEADGEDETEALETIITLINNRFGETA